MNPDLSLYPNRGALDPALWHERSVSTAYRLLCGLGQAELVAYHVSPMATFAAVSHGMTSSGELVVAVSGYDPAMAALGGELPTDVRLSIEKQAPRLDLHIVASSAHLLGKARWLGPAEKERMLISDEIPARVADLASMGEMAFISFERVLLHDACGVTPLCSDLIRDEHEWAQELQEHHLFCDIEPDLFGCPENELLAVETVTNPAVVNLREAFDGVVLGTVQGAFLARQEISGVCEHAVGVTCLDVDRTGITLMCIEQDGAVTAFIPFAYPVSNRTDIVRELRQLG
ncbi:MAG: hypothetical protein ACTHW1_08450 [Ancrocorticia sp.]|uniref:hypothetical protein n=1 Tax=Ancrocorticia sp. TaxID=2593684 RepID=UPI003F8E4FCB